VQEWRVLAVEPGIRGQVRPAWLVHDNVTVAVRPPAGDALDVPLADVAVRMRSAGEAADRTAAVRGMFKTFGVDPTRTRPSSEALLRRVRKGDPLPRINTAVDICNWCSLEFQLPYGLYDLHRIDGAIAVRAGRAGESYPGIRKDTVHVEGRLVVADAAGAFGNPTSDSARTMVTSSARSILTVIFAPASTSTADLHRVLDLTSARMREFAGGVERDRGVT
jgi:DNA/RNA-binding domain of Phe-tRNA-synthetase-like protein